MIKVFPPIYLNPFSKQRTIKQNISASDKSLQEEGKDEQTRIQATKKEADRQIVKDLVKMSNRCIISISSLFPWDFFPNTIDVEEDRGYFYLPTIFGNSIS